MADCRCDPPGHPAAAANPPGLTRVGYRGLDFGRVRRALLQPLPGEQALTDWRPTGQGDLALQIVEWWAYVADVLAFYDERGLNANLLRTASLDADIRGLVRLLGYRPRPGLAASAVVAALIDAAAPVVLPAGFRLESKPSGGMPPQTFETATPVVLGHPHAVPASPPGRLAGSDSRLFLDGTVTTIEPGDLLLLAPRTGGARALLFAVGTIGPGTDGAGRNFTAITPANATALPDADAREYRLLRSARAAGLWKYGLATGASRVTPQILLDAVDRTIAAGQPMVLTAPGTDLLPEPIVVGGTSEQVLTIDGSTTPPLRAPVTRVHPSAATPLGDAAAWDGVHEQVALLIDWRPAGVLRNAPVPRWHGTPARLLAGEPAEFRVGASQVVIIEAADGAGVLAGASVVADAPAELAVTAIEAMPPAGLALPLRVLHDTVPLTRGKTIDREVLGTGAATVPFQEFVLRKSPVTYLPAGDGYVSTLALYVDGVRWQEVASFYGQPPDAQVFVTFEDDEHRTHVRGGDGINGATFPTGAAIVAAYRVESGLTAPAAGALTTIVQPVPGLRGIRAPLVPGGGADPDPGERIRHYGPRSVLTFGRAIAADDYETIAGAAPGVARARASYAWNPVQQRASVTVYVGDTPAALAAARQALALSADPNRPLSIVAATEVTLAVEIDVRIAPDRRAVDVEGAVRRALADADTGLLGERRTGIGEGLFFSQLSQSCAQVPGVVSIIDVRIGLSRPDPRTGSRDGRPPRVHAESGEFLVLRPQDLIVRSR